MYRCLVIRDDGCTIVVHLVRGGRCEVVVIMSEMIVLDFVFWQKVVIVL
jgi:hypothetical protein